MNKNIIGFLSIPFFLVLMVVTSCSSHAQQISQDQSSMSKDESKLDKIHDLVSIYADYGKFNGSVLVADESEVIYKNGFGVANVEWDIPNQVDTKFRLASVTKQFTAMLIMQLVAEEKLALDSSITTYLPDYPSEVGDKVSIHQLLSHTSGIPNYTSFPGYRDMMGQSMSPEELMEVFADSTLKFTPGKRFSYSNSGYVILGVILEKVTGKSFEKVLQEKILTPLKMKNTGIDKYKTVLKNRASGYYKNGDAYTNSHFIDLSMGYTAGGMYSTVEDMFLWDQALYTSILLPQKYKDMLFTKHIPAWGEHYGYGWNVGETSIGNTKEKIKAIHHDGFINGFSSLILRIPSSKSSIILMNNTGGAPMYEMSRAITGILYDKPYDLPKQSVAHALLKTINNQGITKGITFYEKVKGDDTYHLDEREMNMISFELLNSDRGEEAIAVLKLAIEAFPNAFNLYDSYGEILRAQGKKEEAIISYKKSLQLNPKNDNGLKMLSEMGIEIDKESLYLLKTDETWAKEIFTFPLNFAKDLDYQGTEEAHFPKGWRDIESSEFWSYAFAWRIDLDTVATTSQVENDLQMYFDGLMNRVNKKKDFVLPKSIAKLGQKEGSDDVTHFSGTIKVHDSFVTEKNMTLYVTAEGHYCEQEKKSIVLFKFSPKAIGEDIWMELDKLKLRDNKCED